jgi:hypothetical protein
MAAKAMLRRCNLSADTIDEHLTYQLEQAVEREQMEFENESDLVISLLAAHDDPPRELAS